MYSSLENKTFVGILWAGVGQIGSQTIHYFVLVGLAWLLPPSDFGLIGLAMVFVLFITDIGTLGLGAALIQQINSTDEILNTAFWANMALGLLLALLTYLSADMIAYFFRNPSVGDILRVLCFFFPIASVAVVPRALLEKQLNFRSITIRDFASEIAYGAVGLVMAFSGAGVWSLVGATLAKLLASAITLWIYIPWKPQLLFDIPSFKRLFNFGFYSMWSDILTRSVSNIDYFVVGRWLGTEALGYYTLAFQLSVVPARRIVDLIKKVVFPAFSLIQNDILRLRNSFIDGIRYLFVVLAPVCLFILILAPMAIEAMYGDKWLQSIVPLQILAIGGFFYGLDISETLYYAVGKPKARILIIGLRLVLFIVFCSLFGVRLGINGVAISVTLSIAMTSFIGFLYVAQITSSRLIKLLQPVWFAVGITLLACLPAVFINSLFQGQNPWIILITTSMLMGLLYIFILALFWRDFFGNLWRIFNRKLA